MPLDFLQVSSFFNLHSHAKVIYFPQKIQNGGVEISVALFLLQDAHSLLRFRVGKFHIIQTSQYQKLLDLPLVCTL